MNTHDTLEAQAPPHAPKLFAPLIFKRGPQAPNRILKSAMSEVLAKQGVHLPNNAHQEVYERWARGGTGILVSGNVMIDRTALGEPGNVVLQDGTSLDPFKEWVAAVRRGNPKTLFWMQLNHPGKQIPKFLSPEPVAPSAVPLGKGLDKSFAPPRALEDAEIEALIARFATSARLAQEAGFDGVQIHGAHGYLVSQFLSPHHNRRTDRWGGSAENRRRFVLEIYQAIRAAVGEDFPISIKMNSADFQKGGFAEDEAQEVMKALADAGIDLIEISGGNYENPAMTGHRQSTREREGYFLEFAAQARALSEVPLAVTGGFRSVRAMENAVASGACDMVGLARSLTLDPELPRNAACDPAYTRDVGTPSTGFRGMDRMFMLAITYYESQIRRMGRGLDPKPGMSAWHTVWENVSAIGGQAFRKRRQ
ncbi:NADH:flavin oxidoreductase/NADH oxidase family protein [Sulfitobacter aestuariivivens]|uniref:NADH:flavin oxidoreductase/NADH oxidase family protein n=1 Tax=Sulfitobacter aestuariivivens TaxID=2766981 RepID=A0A927D587_9RHOB|nr:NADH:flavin oxidoreductase/NADH oxidase family protein [Sulfitobacter aestuariivivens]MBD3664064.1 NADH:flavin oxidoreductase/NADH oxidase family protein [Sulfitobacter aestuariivivens]